MVTPVFLLWEITDQCNLNCSYCYYKPSHSKDFTKELKLQNFILKKISTIPNEINISILGGEPTLHPNFYEIIETLYNMKNITKILIITNFTKPLEFWEKYKKFNDKIEINISIHFEYFSLSFLDKIDKILQIFKTNILILQHNDKKYIPIFKQIIDYSKNHNWYELSEVELIKLIPPTTYDDEVINYIKTLKINQFKIESEIESFGKSCLTKKLLIKYNGDIFHPCNSKKIGNIYFFDFIPYFKGMEICKTKICNNGNFQQLIIK